MQEVAGLAWVGTVPDDVFRTVVRLWAFADGRAVFELRTQEVRAIADRVKINAAELRLRAACDAAGWRVEALQGGAWRVERPEAGSEAA